MTFRESLRARRRRRAKARRRRALRSYYEEAPLWLPPHPTFRQFRVAVPRGDARLAFLKIDDRVRNETVLRRWLVRLAPEHVYFTTSRWLDPQRLGPREYRGRKAGYRVAHNILLGQELYFDIDAPGEFDLAKADAERVLDCLRREGLEDLRLVYSGNKGFHIHAYDFEEKFLPRLPADPRCREAAVQGARKDLVTRIVEAGIGIDVDVTMDPRRILRLPGTVHGATLNICEFVDPLRLGSFRPRRIPQ